MKRKHEEESESENEDPEVRCVKKYRNMKVEKIPKDK